MSQQFIYNIRCLERLLCIFIRNKAVGVSKSTGNLPFIFCTLLPYMGIRVTELRHCGLLHTYLWNSCKLIFLILWPIDLKSVYRKLFIMSIHISIKINYSKSRKIISFWNIFPVKCVMYCFIFKLVWVKWKDLKTVNHCWITCSLGSWLKLDSLI